MQTKPLFKKGLSVGIIILFVINILPSMSCSSTQNHQSIGCSPQIGLNKISDDVVNWTINGTTGENGWFVSPLTFSCTYDHDVVAAVYTNLNGLYTGPFTITTEGVIDFIWWWVDFQGTVSGIHGPFGFKIDYTQPTIIDYTFRRVGFLKCKFNASVSDNTSGINHVEFWLDDQFIGNCSTYPYFVYWRHSMFLYMLRGFILFHTFVHNPQCIVYDNAGNYCISPSIS